MTYSQLKKLLSVSVFMAGLVASSNLDHTTGKQRNLTQFFNFDDVCPYDGTKKEINMRTGMAVFTFNEAVFKTREKMKRRELSCHLELETYPDYGFHVYIEEMNLNKNQAVCDDFVQFGRDVLFITNFASYKYCGGLPKKELLQQNEDEVTFDTTSSGVSRSPRLYIEEKDREMDIWLTVRKSEDSVDLPPRNLTLVVTVFKKGCGAKDNYFRPCPNTQNCVRREFFCDGYVNCAWPYGEYALDEQKNCEDLRNDLSASSSVFSTANIPVIIIVVIVIVAILVIFFIACNRFIGMVKKPTEGEEDRGLRMPLGHTPQSDNSHTDVCLRTFGAAEFSDSHETSHDLVTRLPSMPPSYDEVVRSGGVQVHARGSRLPSEPPPYSLTTTDI